MQEKRYFFRLGVEKTAIFAAFCALRSSGFGYMVFSQGSALFGVTARETHMASGKPWKALEERMAAAVDLPHRAVAVAFLDRVPEGMDKFDGAEPSGCSFWRLAAEGNPFTPCPRIILIASWAPIPTMCRFRRHAKERPSKPWE